VTDQPLEPDERDQPTRVDVDPERPTEVRPPVEEPTSVQGPTPAPRPTAGRLHRSRDDRVLAGVCGGLGEYFRIDPVLVRIAFVLLIFAGGLGILAYILGWIFIPEAPDRPDGESESTLDRAIDAVGEDRRGGAVVLGLVFVALGILFLLDVAWPDFLSWEYVWPVALIAVGAAIVFRARR
jgi:phage shock protein C